VKFALGFEDKQSPTWRRLKAHLEERLRLARESNDTEQPEERTARTRGEIKVLKELLALDKPAPEK
jgi:hypothetical protein